MNIDKLAIVLLCYADFESLEISLAAYTKFLPKDTKLFILQNGRGSYDCERTYRVAQRYANLFPENIVVVDWIKPQRPYRAIKELLNSDIMKPYEYICKVDDDVFPLTEDWLEKLKRCYISNYKKYGEKLAYVTSLVNNNDFGFQNILKNSKKLHDDYFQNLARNHVCGLPNDSLYPYKIVNKNEIHPYAFGTVWRYPYISRWIHKNTTLDVENFISICSNLKDIEFPCEERYSINCMLFKKNFWNEIDIGHDDDEYQTQIFCKKHQAKVIACLTVPMVHLFFFTQREENKDLIPIIREYYQKRLDIPFPISICPQKEYENENRLRFIEQEIKNKNNLTPFIVKDAFDYTKNKIKYWRCKLLAKLTFGKMRKHYKTKKKELKNRLKQVRSFLKGK